MNTNVKKYLAPSNGKFSLAKFGTSYQGKLSKEAGKLALEAVKVELDKYQEKLYVNGKTAVLIIFQAMDAAGKDSAIEHVMSGLNPQGCEVHSFKRPSTEEYQHDFLWRHVIALPKKGIIGIHNRSHYENVLVTKVHPEYLLNENLNEIKDVKKIDGSFWKKRYESINNFEKHLSDNGTIILKFFLNVSKEEQKERLLERINNPAKNWKYESSDLDERALWPAYMEAYEQAIQETSTSYAPWYVIPADKKWYTRLVVAEVMASVFADLDLKFPTLEKKEKEELQADKKTLVG